LPTATVDPYDFASVRRGAGSINGGAMKSIIATILVAAMLTCAARAASAETHRSHGGGSHHASRSAKRDLIVVKCKTKACFKKHPSGVYAFKPKPKKG
jgi:hypothetical protein